MLSGLATIRSISQEIAASQNAPRLLQQLLEAAQRQIGARSGLIGIFSEGRDTVRTISQVGWKPRASRPPLPANVLAQTLRRGKLSSGTIPPLPSARKKAQPELFLAAPLRLAGNQRGILVLAGKSSPYSEADKKMLEALAALAVLCLENDRLRQAAKGRAQLAAGRGLHPEVLDRLRLTHMGHVAATIAHELRQPLSAIHNLACYLKMTVCSADTKIAPTLELLENQAELAGQILSNLVSFARSGRPQKIATDVHHALERVLKRIAWRPEIHLKQKLARRLPHVYADPLHVDRIISNLVTNGLESMEGCGTLSVATRAERDKVLLQVTDTGCGIHPDHARKIFQPFVTTKRTGTGLGLALCRQLAEANAGSIQFHSRHGKGTTFELRLPQA